MKVVSREEGPAVECVRTGAVAQLILNRDSYRNALSEEIFSGLASLLAQLRDDDSHVVVLRARGKAFCAGAKLDRVAASADILSMRAYHSKGLDLFRMLLEFPKPTISMVQGYALAGGAGLATACDFVIASTSAEFGYPEVDIAAAPSMVMQILMRRVPWRKAVQWCMQGNRIPATEAAQWGLINQAVAPDDLERVAMQLAQELASKAPGALRMIKELAIMGPDLGAERALRYAREISTITAFTEETRQHIGQFFAARRRDSEPT